MARRVTLTVARAALVVSVAGWLGIVLALVAR
jgi:hypothetical protein